MIRSPPPPTLPSRLHHPYNQSPIRGVGEHETAARRPEPVRLPTRPLQALGIDAAGRRQYRYHEVWRDAAQFDDILRVGRRLPRIRRRVGEHLGARGLSRDRILPTIVRLLDLGCFRIGEEEYATGEDATFGLATLRCEHANLVRGAVRFSHPAKGGMLRELEVDDERVRALASVKTRSDKSISESIIATRTALRRYSAWAAPN